MKRAARVIGVSALLAIGAVGRDEFQGSNLWVTINGTDGAPSAASSWKKSQ